METNTYCEKFKFSWKIENFSFCNFGNEGLVSSTFEVDCISNSKWSLRLFPTVLSSSNGEFTSCQLQNLDLEDEEAIIVDFEIEILNNSGIVLAYWKEEECTFQKSVTCKEQFLKNEVVQLNDVLTLICHIKQKKTREVIVTDCEACTIINIEKAEFRCHVTYLKNEDVLKIIKNFKSGDLYLRLTCSDNSYICIAFHSIQTKHSKSRFMACKISLLDIYGRERNAITFSQLFTKDAYELHFPISEIKLNNAASEFLNEGRITLLFDISVSAGTSTDKIPEIIYPLNVRYLKYPTCGVSVNLSNELKKIILYQEPQVELNVEGMTCAVHKDLLIIWSKVFATIFEQSTIESESEMVTIKELDAETLPIFVDFLYTQHIKPVNYKNVKKLMFAAIRYQIDTLKNKCSEMLLADNSEENTLDLIMFAELIGYEHLINRVMDRINIQSGKFLFSEEFYELYNENFLLGISVLKKWGEDQSDHFRRKIPEICINSS